MTIKASGPLCWSDVQAEIKDTTVKCIDDPKTRKLTKIATGPLCFPKDFYGKSWGLSNLAILVVGGGHGGISSQNVAEGEGGGDGGQVVQFSITELPSGTYPVVVGQGGQPGSAGGASTFYSRTANGGAGAGAQGSGWGSGGGGAGAGGPGGAPGRTQGGAGGPGVQWGDGKWYAGGGGGGAGDSGGSVIAAGAGGSGVGGGGGTCLGPIQFASQDGTHGGGGGGGSSMHRSGQQPTGGRGGNGVVVIRYAGTPVATGGRIVQAGGFTYHYFENAGSFQFKS